MPTRHERRCKTKSGSPSSSRATSDLNDDEAGALDLADIARIVQAQVPPALPETAPGAAALVEAASAGDQQAVARHLAAGVPVDAQAPWRPSGATGAAAAIVPAYAVTALYAAASENRPEVIDVLIAGGADPNGRIHQGSTALTAAACGGHLASVEALLAAGADLLGGEGA